MEKDFEVLLSMSLFEGISPQELTAILGCLKASKAHYQKNEIVLPDGGDIKNFGVVLSGSVQILKNDVAGRQTILSVLGAGETFAEVLVCAGVKESPVTVLAVTDTDVMYLNYEHVVRSCSSACSFHTRLISNMLRVLAQKNLAMNSKIAYLTLKSMRQKLAAFLLEQCKSRRKTDFSISFSREGLAGYLNVDRSAMSRELCRMRDEGLIAFEKNKFQILSKEELSQWV